ARRSCCTASGMKSLPAPPRLRRANERAKSAHRPVLPEERSRVKGGSVTRVRLNPTKPPKTDWRAFDALSEEERHRAALSDLGVQPATKAQLARARRVSSVRALRKKHGRSAYGS